MWHSFKIYLSFQLHTWNPTIQNPYCGQVVWAVPENVEIQVTLFRDSRHSEYEDKEWTFVIEDVSFRFFLFETEGAVFIYSDIEHQALR